MRQNDGDTELLGGQLRSLDASEIREVRVQTVVNVTGEYFTFLFTEKLNRTFCQRLTLRQICNFQVSNKSGVTIISAWHQK